MADKKLVNFTQHVRFKSYVRKLLNILLRLSLKKQKLFNHYNIEKKLLS